uniref:VWFA domain-containing protein n=1 Tax=Rhabditophanes sp. KR3021 TaxID=114890 RepID=A0AC35TI20_9BILA
MMKTTFISLLLLATSYQAFADDCLQGNFNPPQLTDANLAYASPPSVDGNVCNIGPVTMSISTNNADRKINIFVQGATNFVSSKATLQFFNGDAPTPNNLYFTINDDNEDTIQLPPSSSNIVTVLYNINPAVQKDIPDFTIFAKAIIPVATTTVVPALAQTTTLLPSETTTVIQTTTVAVPVQTTTVIPTTLAPVDTTTLVPTTLAPADTTTVIPTTTVAVPLQTTTVIQTTLAPVDATTLLPTTLAPADTTTAIPTTTLAVPLQTTTLIQTTLAPVDTTTLAPTLSPVTITPNPALSEGDILLVIDASVSNNALLKTVATDIINSLQIQGASLTRVNIITLGKKASTASGWNHSPDVLIPLINGITTLNANVSIRNNDFGLMFADACQTSVKQRPRVQRTALFITDNDYQKADPAINALAQAYINNNDIHPILLNINPLLDANNFRVIPKAFDGSDSNQIVLYNFVSNKDLFENVLLNPTVLCNLNTLGALIDDADEFNFPYQGYMATTKIKNYCNYMSYSFKCVGDVASPITVSLSNYALQSGKDFVNIYDDQGTLRAVFGGVGIVNSVEEIGGTAFITFEMKSDASQVFTGIDAKFTNCTISA